MKATFPNQEEIDKAVAALPEEKKQIYNQLKVEYEKATESDTPDHEKIAELIWKGSKRKTMRLDS